MVDASADIIGDRAENHVYKPGLMSLIQLASVSLVTNLFNKHSCMAGLEDLYYRIVRPRRVLQDPHTNFRHGPPIFNFIARCLHTTHQW